MIWLVGAAVIWASGVRVTCLPSAGGAVGGPRGGAAPARRPPAVAAGPAAWHAGLYAVLLFAVLIAPEIGRMIDFHSFETFDPNGPGLGNLFGQISPFEALGIWPSGDFRLSPGDGAVPALGYFPGAAFASILLVYGLVLCWRRRETALIAGLAAAALAYAAARIGGTPYTAAKAIEIGAPLAALVIVLPLLRRPVAWLYLLAAAGCSLLAFANAPVGPSSYSPALTGLRDDVGEGPTLVLASSSCSPTNTAPPTSPGSCAAAASASQPPEEAERHPPPGVRFVVTESSRPRPPFPGLRRLRIAPPYVLWEATSRRTATAPAPS